MKVLILLFILGCSEMGVQSHNFGGHHDGMESAFSSFNATGVSFHSVGLMFQPLLSCFSTELQQMMDSCRTTSLSVMLSMGPRGGYGARGHRFRRHSPLMSALGQCILTKLGANNSNTDSVNVDTLITNLINKTTLMGEKKTSAIANFTSCYANFTGSLLDYHGLNNNVSRAVLCSSTALLKNGCATNTSQTEYSSPAAVSPQSLQMPIASYSEVSEQMKELNISLCNENGTVTEPMADEDKLISGYYDGYHAPKFLYRRRQFTRKPKIICRNATDVPTTTASTTTEENVESTTSVSL